MRDCSGSDSLRAAGAAGLQDSGMRICAIGSVPQALVGGTGSATGSACIRSPRAVTSEAAASAPSLGDIVYPRYTIAEWARVLDVLAEDASADAAARQYEGRRAAVSVPTLPAGGGRSFKIGPGHLVLVRQLTMLLRHATRAFPVLTVRPEASI